MQRKIGFQSLDVYLDQFKARLFPLRKCKLCDPESKRPLGRWGDSKPIPIERLEQYLEAGHGLGWALGPEDLIVDVDAPTAERPDKKGRESLEKLKALGIDLDALATVVVETKSGGRHYYLTKPAEVQIHKSISAYPGVEFLSSGCYVVTAGSPHWQGGEYSFDEVSALAGDFERRAAPAALLELIERKPVESTQAPATVTTAQLERLLAALDPTGYRDYPDWRKILFASHSATGGSPEGRETFVAWSTQDPKYAGDADKIQELWRPLNADKLDGVTSATLLAEVREVDPEVAREISAELDFEPVEEPTEPKAEKRLRVYSLAELERDFPRMRDPVLDGLLRKGEIANVVAAPKVGKSWLVLGLAFSVATGRDWLGVFPAKRGRVLMVDNELHAATLSDRAKRVRERLGLAPEAVQGRIDILPIRGQGLFDLVKLRKELETLVASQIEPYSLIVLDALYRFLPSDKSENDNGAIAELYNVLQGLAERSDAAIVVVHHTSKGEQGSKATTDVGAGAGSQSRAADVHIAIRPHQTDGLFVLDAVARSFPEPGPLSLRFEFPVFDRDGAPALLETQESKKKKQAQAAQAAKDRDGLGILKQIIRDAGSPISARQIRNDWANYSEDEKGVGVPRLTRLLEAGIQSGDLRSAVVDGVTVYHA